MAPVVRVVDGVGGADEADALANVGGTPSFTVDAELVPLSELNCSPVVVYLLGLRHRISA